MEPLMDLIASNNRLARNASTHRHFQRTTTTTRPLNVSTSHHQLTAPLLPTPPLDKNSIKLLSVSDTAVPMIASKMSLIG